MSTASPRIAAFATISQVVEPLDTHLALTSINAYTVARAYTPQLGVHALLAGLLHDLGKILRLYQGQGEHKCLPSKANPQQCSYTGHEVFSAILVAQLLKNTKTLSQEDKRIIVYAVLAHHQYMGTPIERLEKLLRKLEELRLLDKKRMEPVSLLEPAIDVSQLLRNTIQQLRREKLLEESVEAVRAVEEVEEEAKHLSNPAPILGTLIETIEPENTLRKLLGELSPTSMDTREERVKARILAGILIASDNYTAAINRRGTVPRHFKTYIEYAKLLSTSNQQLHPQPYPNYLE